jgi:hypothetical protein
MMGCQILRVLLLSLVEYVPVYYYKSTLFLSTLTPLNTYYPPMTIQSTNQLRDLTKEKREMELGEISYLQQPHITDYFVEIIIVPLRGFAFLHTLLFIY